MATPRSHEPAADPDQPKVHPDDLLAAVNGQPEGEVEAPGTAVEMATPAGLALADGPLAAFAGGNEWAGADSGLENWDHVGMTIPRIVSDMRPGGGWTDEVTTAKADMLEVIILAAMPARAWWKGDYGEGTGVPECRSGDMVRPDPGSTEPQSATCAICPHAQWGGDEAPACKERINTLTYLPGSGEIRRLTISGTSVKHFRRYVSGLRARALPKPVFAQVTVAEAVDVDNGKMRWLEAHFTEGDPVDPKLAMGTLVPLQREVSAAWKSMIAQDLASGEADGTAVARDGVIDVEDHDEPF